LVRPPDGTAPDLPAFALAFARRLFCVRVLANAAKPPVVFLALRLRCFFDFAAALDRAAFFAAGRGRETTPPGRVGNFRSRL
jgi:hypothetical protein